MERRSTREPATALQAVPESGQLTSSGRVILLHLRAAMLEAHARVVTCRQRPVDVPRLLAARRAYVCAMTAYEQALRALHLPVPPRLRDDLRLLRRLVAS
jgi:hypothetical protein